MPTYSYRAKDSAGAVHTGTLSGDSERAIADQLAVRGLFALTVEGREASREATPSQPARRRGRITADEITLFIRQLADLLRAGVPLVRALSTLRRQTSSARMAEVAGDLGETVSGGSSLADALARHPAIFPKVSVALVQAGEAGGFLEDVLERLASFRERQGDLRMRVLTALLYPLLLVVLGTAAVVFLLIYVVPQFVVIFEDLGGALPWPTRVMLAGSHFLAAYWPLLGVGLVVGGFVLRRSLATPQGRLVLDRIRLRLPGLRAVTLRVTVTRFAQTLGTLLRSGVPILDAIQIARDAAGNEVLGREIDVARTGVREGRGLAESLAHSRILPPVVLSMIAIGEETGTLDDVLAKIADNFDRQLDHAVKAFVTVVEPGMILVMGGVVGFIVMAMLLPIFTLNTLVQ